MSVSKIRLLTPGIFQKLIYLLFPVLWQVVNLIDYLPLDFINMGLIAQYLQISLFIMGKARGQEASKTWGQDTSKALFHLAEGQFFKQGHFLSQWQNLGRHVFYVTDCNPLTNFQ